MKKAFKKYFVPHEGNGHRPHILRDEAALAVIGTLLFLELCFLAGSYAIIGSSFLASILPAVLTEETNARRAAAGVPTLTYSALLEKAATLKAHDMAEKGYFAHTSPAGVTPWYWLGEVGYDFTAAGENLAVNYFDSKDVADAWMNSPTHRANVMNPQFSEIGIGFAEGTYEGKNTVFVAEFFGTPTLAVPAVPADTAVVPVAVLTDSASSPSVEPLPPASVPSLPAEVTAMMDAAVQDNADDALRASAAGMPVPSATAVKGIAIYRAAASPRRTMGWVIAGFMTVIAAAMAIKIFVTAYARRSQEHGLIVNGMIMLIIMVAVLALNSFIGLLPSVI